MTTNIDELGRLARAATPGPWKTDRSFGDNQIATADDKATVCDFAVCAAQDAAFIAAANPAAVLELIERLGRAEQDTARLDWLADPANAIGNVELPTQCVLDNPESLRGAIDAAMEVAK